MDNITATFTDITTDVGNSDPSAEPLHTYVHIAIGESKVIFYDFWDEVKKNLCTFRGVLLANI